MPFWGRPLAVLCSVELCVLEPCPAHSPPCSSSFPLTVALPLLDSSVQLACVWEWKQASFCLPVLLILTVPFRGSCSEACLRVSGWWLSSIVCLCPAVARGSGLSPWSHGCSVWRPGVMPASASQLALAVLCPTVWTTSPGRTDSGELPAVCGLLESVIL